MLPRLLGRSIPILGRGRAKSRILRSNPARILALCGICSRHERSGHAGQTPASSAGGTHEVHEVHEAQRALVEAAGHRAPDSAEVRTPKRACWPCAPLRFPDWDGNGTWSARALQPCVDHFDGKRGSVLSELETKRGAFEKARNGSPMASHHGARVSAGPGSLTPPVRKRAKGQAFCYCLDCIIPLAKGATTVQAA